MNLKEKNKLYLMNEINKMKKLLSMYIDINEKKDKIGIGVLTDTSYCGLFLVADKWFIYEWDEHSKLIITGPYSFNGAAYFFLSEFFDITIYDDDKVISNEDKKSYYYGYFHSYNDVINYVFGNSNKDKKI